MFDITRPKPVARVQRQFYVIKKGYWQDMGKIDRQEFQPWILFISSANDENIVQ